MFGRKAKKLDIGDISQFIEYPDRFPRPNWDDLNRFTEEKFPEAQRDEAWTLVAKLWLTKLIDALGSKYQLHESDNFLVVTSESDRYARLFKESLERSRRRILRALDGIANDAGYGKHVVVIFDTQDEYYPYVLHYYPKKGEFSFSSGMYLNYGYGHFVFPHQEINLAEPIAAHELTHACLSHLPIPLWLNEGIATAIEDSLFNTHPLRFDNELHRRHKKFWNENTIQEFWSGRSFYRPGESNELSYNLARFSVDALAKDFTVFRKFALAAHHNDSGQSASKEIFGVSLGLVIEAFLGKGNWSPQPGSWNESDKRTVGL